MVVEWAHLVRVKYKRLEGIAKFLIQEGVKYGIARAVGSAEPLSKWQCNGNDVFHMFWNRSSKLNPQDDNVEGKP
jgi:hypothetical protein